MKSHSTTAIWQSIELESKHAPAVAATFVVDFDGQAEFAQIGNHQLTLFAKGQAISLKTLEKELVAIRRLTDNKTFWNALTEKQKLAIENYKLALMLAVQDNLQKNYQTPQLEAPKQVPKNSLWRWLLFGGVLVLEVLPMLCGGFIGLSQILTAVPGFTEAAAYITSAILCFVEGFLFYSVMSPLLKRAFGISTEQVSTPRVETYGKQLLATKNLDKILTVDNKMSADDYQRYTRIGNLMSDNITDLNATKLMKFKESKIKKVARAVLSGFTTLLNFGNGYFFAISLLMATATTAALIGTPIGWGIVAFIILGQIGLRLAVRSNAMVYTLNPGAERHDNIKAQINDFKPNTAKYADILSAKKAHEKLQEHANDLEFAADLKKNPYTDDFYRARKTTNTFFTQPAFVPNNQETGANEFERFDYSEATPLLKN